MGYCVGGKTSSLRADNHIVFMCVRVRPIFPCYSPLTLPSFVCLVLCVFECLHEYVKPWHMGLCACVWVSGGPWPGHSLLMLLPRGTSGEINMCVEVCWCKCVFECAHGVMRCRQAAAGERWPTLIWSVICWSRCNAAAPSHFLCLNFTLGSLFNFSFPFSLWLNCVFFFFYPQFLHLALYPFSLTLFYCLSQYLFFSLARNIRSNYITF